MTNTKPNQNQCPACGRYTGNGSLPDKFGSPESPGWWDYTLHVAAGGECDEAAEQAEGAACYCDPACADRFHRRCFAD